MPWRPTSYLYSEALKRLMHGFNVRLAEISGRAPVEKPMFEPSRALLRMVIHAHAEARDMAKWEIAETLALAVQQMWLDILHDDPTAANSDLSSAVGDVLRSSVNARKIAFHGRS